MMSAMFPRNRKLCSLNRKIENPAGNMVNANKTKEKSIAKKHQTNKFKPFKSLFAFSKSRDKKETKGKAGFKPEETDSLWVDEVFVDHIITANKEDQNHAEIKSATPKTNNLSGGDRPTRNAIETKEASFLSLGSPQPVEVNKWTALKAAVLPKAIPSYVAVPSSGLQEDDTTLDRVTAIDTDKTTIPTEDQERIQHKTRFKAILPDVVIRSQEMKKQTLDTKIRKERFKRVCLGEVVIRSQEMKEIKKGLTEANITFVHKSEKSLFRDVNLLNNEEHLATICTKKATHVKTQSNQYKIFAGIALFFALIAFIVFHFKDLWNV